MSEPAHRLIVSAMVTAVIFSMLTVAVRASPGSSCQHTPQCGHGEVCLADGPFATVGHCVKLRILP
jgi:hypothetical protein